MTDKIWGTSQRLLINEFCQIEKITVVAGGYSSIHLHRLKHNMFIVQSGLLTVADYGDYTDPKMLILFDELESSSRDLGPGESWMVPSTIKHQFHAKTPTIAWELYWAPPDAAHPLDPDDIVRFSENGVQPSSLVQVATDEQILCCCCSLPLRFYYPVIWQRASRQMCESCCKKTGAERMVLPS